ncbi:MAG: putative motility protein [Epulopiscium sp.]|nr:putative motility protein [Candidatus Epulonipiscium sp.]
MNIEAMSTVLSQAQIKQEVSTTMLKNVMDQAKMQMTYILKMADVSRNILEQSLQPHLGQNIDISI